MGTLEMPIEIAVEKLSHLQIVSLRGRLDSAGTPAFESSMHEVIESGEKRVLIDCSELRYVSSVGLAVFISSAKTLGASGGGLYFAGLTQHVRSVFEMVGFFGMFEIYPSLQEALESPGLRGSG
jgi:anti-sigma B factor antagonist